MGKTKVILDTNILISSIGWEGNPKRILERCEKKEIILVMSIDQFDELCRVLEYPKFEFNEEQKNKFKSLISEIAIFIQPKTKVEIVKEDPDDNMILETALEGNVSFIITGDPHLLKLKEFQGIKIINASEFIKLQIN